MQYKVAGNSQGERTRIIKFSFIEFDRHRKLLILSRSLMIRASPIRKDEESQSN